MQGEAVAVEPGERAPPERLERRRGDLAIGPRRRVERGGGVRDEPVVRRELAALRDPVRVEPRREHGERFANLRRESGSVPECETAIREPP